MVCFGCCSLHWDVVAYIGKLWCACRFCGVHLMFWSAFRCFGVHREVLVCIGMLCCALECCGHHRDLVVYIGIL